MDPPPPVISAMRAPVKAKNKAPAPMQITAEQILREAAERQDVEIKPPKQRITDPEELAMFRLRKRKGYEDALRINRQNMTHWLNYAKFEEEQAEFERARSVFERALEVDHRDKRCWLAYAEMEMRNRHVNAARNVLDRAVTLLPRVDGLWLKYVAMEEMLGNLGGARAVFERWVAWQPADHAWLAFIRLETRHNNAPGARAVYARYVRCHQLPRAYGRWAKWEEAQGEVARARAVFEAALEELRDDLLSDELFVRFAEFEERQTEYERARVIYKYALSLDSLPEAQREALSARHAQFERAHGDRAAVEDVVVAKKRAQYEEAVAAEPLQYDHWFDYARLEESLGAPNAERVRDVYERAVAHAPPGGEKRHWRRYIYLWLKYAIFEEAVAKEYGRCRAVLGAARRLVPHARFTFAKLWIHSAHFELRRGQLGAARKLLGAAIGCAPKPKLFRAYVQLELQLGEIERCRTLYEKWVSWAPHNAAAWIAFAQLEASLAEHERARAVHEIAISQPALDMPELAWKAYIDFEAELGEEPARVRALYARLLERTKHVKVWLSWARWEEEACGPGSGDRVFEDAHAHFKAEGLKAERLAVLEGWLQCARARDDAERVSSVEGLLPKRVKKKRALVADDGTDGGWEEYYDYVYPDEQAAQPSLKILEMAHKWKRQRAEGEEEA